MEQESSDSVANQARCKFIESLDPFVNGPTLQASQERSLLFTAKISSAAVIRKGIASPELTRLSKQINAIHSLPQEDCTTAEKVEQVKPLVQDYIQTKQGDPTRKRLFNDDGGLPLPASAGQINEKNLNSVAACHPNDGKVKHDTKIPPVKCSSSSTSSLFMSFAEAHDSLGPHWKSRGYEKGKQHTRKYACTKTKRATGEKCKGAVLITEHTNGSATVEEKTAHNHRVDSPWQEWAAYLDGEGHRALPLILSQFVEEIKGSPSGRTFGPKDIARLMEEKFAVDERFRAVFSKSSICRKMHRKVNNKLGNMAKAKKKAGKGNSQVDVIRLVTTHDLKIVKENHSLKIPNNFTPTKIGSPEHMREVAKQIVGRGSTMGISHLGDRSFPDRDLVFLPVPERKDIDPKILKVIDEFEKKRPQNKPTLQNSAVMSSLALLRLVVDCDALDFQVTGSMDGIHGVLQNDFRLVCLGVIANSKEHSQDRVYTQTLKPLVYTLAPAENVESIIYMMLALFKAVEELFGIPPFCMQGGVVIDRCSAFLRALKLFCPDVHQCYPHIFRKFNPNDRKGNGNYINEYAKDKKYAAGTCQQDIQSLHWCMTAEQFHQYANLALQEWVEKGEGKMANTFRKSYLAKDYHGWFYTVTGIKGNTPQNQSSERLNLDTKGSSFFRGIISKGQSWENFVYVEMPKLLWVLSSERGALEIQHQILDFNKALKAKSARPYEDERLPYQEINDTDPAKDVYWCEERQCHFVNTIDHKGEDIDKERIDRYELAKTGRLPVLPEDREEIIEATSGLCIVKQEQLQTKEVAYSGSCVDFWKRGSCAHALLLQYPTDSLVYSNQLPKKAASRVRRKRKLNQKKKSKMSAEKVTAEDTGTNPCPNIITQCSQV